MAFDILPSTFEEAGKAVKFMNQTSAIEALSLYRYLIQHYGHVVQNPLAFDSSKKNECKIIRLLEGGFTIKQITKELSLTKLRPDFGDGSRGKKGKNNQGSLFERDMEVALNKWIDTNTIENNKYKSFIEDIIKYYKLDKCQKIIVVPEGKSNKKRPMKLVNEHWEVGTASRNNGYDIGSTVTDITLDTECNNKKRKIYLSLKTSGTTNLSNLGLKTTVFPVDEVKAGKIEQKDGKALIETFGLNEQFLCATFNEFNNGNRRYHQVDTNPSYSRSLIKELIKGSLGYGYHYVHLQRGTKIKHLEIDENFLEKASTPKNVKISYGGDTGGKKRVNIHMETPVFNMVFNIRNTTDKGTTADPLRVYPDKLQTKYTMKGETVATGHQGDSTEIADDS